jgi:hypothetical protein
LSARKKLLESLGSTLTKPDKQSNRVAVPPRFVADFELVAAHYNLKALGEYDQAKQAARNDMENAIVCFASLAAEIKHDIRNAA